MKKKKKAKKKFDLKRAYAESWKYLKTSRKFIYLAIGIFFFFVLIGAFVPVSESFSKQLMEMLREIVEKLEGKTTGGLILAIFWNNFKASFFSTFLGIFFGVIPFFMSLSNGYILGFVSEISVSQYGILSLGSLLPHGIFELPAIFISIGIGFRLGNYVFKKDKRKNLIKEIFEAFRVFLLIVVPLLVIAAIIEGILVS